MMNVAPSTGGASAPATATIAAGSSGSSGLPVVSTEKDKDSQWYFTADELANSPSRRLGIASDMELSFRQMTAYLIQEMGQRLKVSQLCINTAIVYMHRFYAFHSFTHFHRNGIASASLFLAAKVEEQPRKLEHVIKAANKCLSQPTLTSADSFYLEQAQDLVFNENVLLQTLGFDVAIDHPHTHVVKTCHLVKACKDLTKTSYFLASNSLHLTSMCLQYRPTVVACFCIYLACKWSRWEIPQSTEGKHWFHYVDKTVTMELLKQLTDEFIAIYEKSPARLKSKLNSIKALAQGAGNNRPVGKDKKGDDWKMSDLLKMYHSSIPISENSNHSSGSDHQTQQHSPHMSMPPMLPPPQQQQQQNIPPQQQQSQLQQQMQMSQNQQQSQQPIRKSDMHSSQRSQSHHSKHGFPSIGEMTDHKSSYKNTQQQQSQSGFNSGGNQNATASAGYSSSGRIRDHSQGSQQTSLPPPAVPSNQASRSSISNLPSNNRTVSSGGLSVSQTNVRQQQVPSSGILMDNHNYQKIRERSASMHSVPSGLHNALPPHSAASHKLPSKSDNSSRMLVKESKHKLFGSSSISGVNAANTLSSSGLREFSNNQLTTSSAGSSSKMESSHDMSSRSTMQHNQRSSHSANNNNNNLSSVSNSVLGNLGYNVQSTSQHRQQQSQLNPSNSVTASGKIDHGKSMSNNNNNSNNVSANPAVHMSQMHKSNPMSLDAAFNNAHELQSSQSQGYASQQNQQTNSFLSTMRSFDHLLNDDSLNSMYGSNVLQTSTAATHSQIKPTTSLSSMFGGNTENIDTKLSHNMGLPTNTFATGNPASSDTNGSHRSSVTNMKNELSPRSTHSTREKDRERFKVSPSSKKEKHRHSLPSTALPSSTFGTGMESSLSGLAPGALQQHKSLPPYLYKKSDSNGNEQHSSLKRPIQNVKQEEEIIRQYENKMQTLDKLLSSSSAGVFPLHSDTKPNDMGKLGHVVNGIETNPDMVRNLLKGNLCPSVGLIKPDVLLSAPDSKPPAELFATPYEKEEPTTTSILKMNVESSKSAMPSLETLPLNTSASMSSNGEADESADSKDREKHKKNKKEKHKHKEKDKSKDRDREERKKHKKDKDRHKEKERERDETRAGGQQRAENERPTESVERFKIKIRKEVLENNALNPPPFKIKIPKDRITGNLSLGGQPTNNATTSHYNSTSAAGGSIPTPKTNPEQKSHNPTLKIKISKDKIENYLSTATTSTTSVPSYSSTFEQPTVSNSYLISDWPLPNLSVSDPFLMKSETTGGSTHSHSHHSSSGSGSGSSKKKDRDRDRSRDRERDKKRHCSDNSKSIIGGNVHGGWGGSTSHGHSSHSSSTHTNNKH